MLQNYFGIALGSGAKSVAELKTKLITSFFHVASSEDCNYHTYCRATKYIWCQYQRDGINVTNVYKPDKGFHHDVIKHVKPEYVKLTDETELSKRLHGQTQNSLFWVRAMKLRYCGLSKLKLCVYDAISYFN